MAIGFNFVSSNPQAAFSRAIAQLGEKELKPKEWEALIGNVNGFRARSYLLSMLTAFRADASGRPLPMTDKSSPTPSRGFYRLYRIPGWRGLVKRVLWVLRLRDVWPYSRLDRWVHVGNEAYLSKAKYWTGGRHVVGLSGSKAPAPPGYTTGGGTA